MPPTDIEKLFAARERCRMRMASLPIEEKIRAIIRLQQMAAPILKQRGKHVRCWNFNLAPHA